MSKGTIHIIDVQMPFAPMPQTDEERQAVEERMRAYAKITQELERRGWLQPMPSIFGFDPPHRRDSIFHAWPEHAQINPRREA